MPTVQNIATAHFNSPFVSVYPWSGLGFGSKIADSSTPPPSAYGISFSPNGNNLAISSSSSPFIFAYPWNGYTFGTKFSDPGTLPGISANIAFSSNNNALALATTFDPRVVAYPWSGSGFGSKFSDPGTIPSNYSNAVAFGANSALGVANSSSPFVLAYPWSGSGFGSKFSDPGTLPAGRGIGVAFTNAADAIAVAHVTSPFVSAYPWSGSGFGTKKSNPATLPVTYGSSAAFTNVGDFLAIGHGGSPFISVYPWSGSGFGTKKSNPGTLPAGNGKSVSFNYAGDTIAVGHSNSPFISTYPWSGSGFGSKFSNPGTLPSGTIQQLSFGLTTYVPPPTPKKYKNIMLKQSTAVTRTVYNGTTGLTSTSYKLSKAGGALANAGGAVTELSLGWYSLTLTTTDTNTLGSLGIYIVFSDASVITVDDQVVTELPGEEWSSDLSSGYSGTMAGNIVNAIKAKTDNLPASPAATSDCITAAGVRTAVGLASANMDTQLSNINSKTTNLPSSPAAVGDIMKVSSGTGANQINLAAGLVTVGTNNDKTGYSLTQAFPTNFASTAIDTNGRVKVQSGITKNTAISNFSFTMFDSADHVTPKTGLTITAQRSIDGAAFGACTNSPAAISNGVYKIDLSASDLNGNVIELKFTATGADPLTITILTTS